jgi:MFS family permease
MLLTAAGSALASLGDPAALVTGSLVIGAAYGLLNPAASDILVRHALAGQRSLIFAIKQTGVPLGGIAAGLLGPPLAVAYGWHAPPWVVSAARLLVAFASESMQPSRACAASRGCRCSSRSPCLRSAPP